MNTNTNTKLHVQCLLEYEYEYFTKSCDLNIDFVHDAFKCNFHVKYTG